MIRFSEGNMPGVLIKSMVGRVIGRLLAGVLLLTSPGGASPAAAIGSPNGTRAAITQDSKREPDSLEPGRTLERKLAGGESHLYEIKMTVEQFVRVLVDQRGIDVSLTLFGPQGEKIIDVDNVRGERGVEAASLIAKNSGTYRFEVSSRRKTDPLAGYQIKIERQQPANEQDRAENSAEHLISEAGPLFNQLTTTSLNQAIAKYQAAMSLLESADDPRMKALTLSKIGACYYWLNNYQKAIEYYNQGLPLARSVADRQLEALLLTNLGGAYRDNVESQKALDHLSQALEIWRAIEDRRGEMEATIITGSIYFSHGEEQKALFYYDEALQLAHTFGDQRQQARLASAIGLTYYSLGDHYQALEIFQQGLGLARASRYQGMEATLLAHLGSVYHALGEYKEAVEHLGQALQLDRGMDDRLREATTLQTIGRVHRSTGDYQQALEYLNQSLVILRDLNSPTAVARGHYNLGVVYNDLRQYEFAVDHLNQALLLWKPRGDSANLAATIVELARAEEGRGNLDSALSQSERAIDMIEWLRAQAGASEQRASFLATVQDCYELRIEVLTRLHKLNPSKNYAALALQTSERARARTLLEAVAEAGIDVRQGVSPDLLKRERTIAEDLSAKAAEEARLSFVKAADARAVELRNQVKELTAQYEKVEAQIRVASPRYAELIQPQPLSVDEIRQQVIDSQTLLLEYYLGEERSYLWAITSNSIESYELPKRAVIEAATRNVYELFTTRNRHLRFETDEKRRTRIAKADADYPPAAAALSQMVLGPVAERLSNRRLLIVSDGALQYIPFAALPSPVLNGSNGFEPLAVTHEVVSLPSASTLAILRRQVGRRNAAPKTIAVLADPVFEGTDDRVKYSLARNQSSQSNTTLASARRGASISKKEMERSASESGWDGEAVSMSRLPFTRREADAIANLVPTTHRKADLDFDASLSNAMNPELSQYRIVHFATHGFLNSRHPELSGVVLSLVDRNGKEQDGFLRAHEIYELKLPADLIVLSGCRTGLGKEIRGEGLVGLTRAFMHAGAARVMVSLWDVNDEATAELMKRFYAGLFGRERLSPAAGLRAAQISMSRDKRWSAPYFWAGFVLQGEPR